MRTDTTLWQQYEYGQEYQRALGLNEKFRNFVAFKEGEQWAPATARTRNLPRPVFNMVEMFIRQKRAHVLNQCVMLSYTPDETGGSKNEAEAAQNAKDMTDYTKQLWERLGQDTLNDELIDDAATLGTGALHYFFDPTVAVDGSLPFVGEIRGETVDPLNLFFAQPQQRDVQKQPYVIIASRRPVEEVRQMAARYGVTESLCANIVPDDAAADGYTAAQIEMCGTEMCTLLTKYYRINGEVVFDRATRAVHLVRAQSLTPAGRRKITRYPIAVMTWKPRKQCIYGIGEAEGLIPNQKALNYNIGMLLLSVQQTAWPKLLSTPGAIRQPVTNEPGEHLIDYSAGGGGIRYLNPPAFGSTAMNLSTAVLELSRTISGVSEVMTGEKLGNNMAASAIIALQTQARATMTEIQKRYWNVLQQVGHIWLQLIRAYYVQDRLLVTEENGTTHKRRFNGARCGETALRLSVDVGAASEYSEVLVQATLEMLLNSGHITIDQYIELAPEHVVPFKERLRQMRAENAKKAEQQPTESAQTALAIKQPKGAEAVTLPHIPTLPTVSAKQ